MAAVALVISAAMLALRGTAKALTLLAIALLMVAYPLGSIALVISAAMLALRGTAIALVGLAIAMLLWLVLIATKLLFDLVLDLFE